MFDKRLTRTDPNRLMTKTNKGLDVTIFANEDVPVESSAVTELMEFLQLEDTVDKVLDASPGMFNKTPEITKIAITPDFHKARGIPVGTVIETKGFVVPQAIGNDINCGMRLHVTDLDINKLKSKIGDIESGCRHVYFGGGRNIPMNKIQREGLFRDGLMSFLDTIPKSQTEGLWSLFHEFPEDLTRVENLGSFSAKQTFALDDFLGKPELTRDGQIGSIGGGNHFCEIQQVHKIYDSKIAYAWGLQEGDVTVMVHSGSLSIGHLCGGYYRDKVREIYPNTIKYPENGIFILPDGHEKADLFWDCLKNAANFAFANRYFLALMMFSVLKNVFNKVSYKLVYDAPHNLVWKEGDRYIHRKGATTARGYEHMKGTPFEYYGEPVLVPGSMGASSFVMVGKGNPDSLCSASHGAGRALSRGESSKGHEEEFKKFLEEFYVVTPVDLNSPELRMRPDIVAEKLKDIKQEAPYAYKGIGPIVKTLTDAGLADPVVELKPILTCKG